MSIAWEASSQICIRCDAQVAGWHPKYCALIVGAAGAMALCLYALWLLPLCLMPYACCLSLCLMPAASMPAASMPVACCPYTCCLYALCLMPAALIPYACCLYALCLLSLCLMPAADQASSLDASLRPSQIALVFVFTCMLIGDQVLSRCVQPQTSCLQGCLFWAGLHHNCHVRGAMAGEH